MAEDVKPNEDETVSEPLQDDPASEDVVSDEQLDEANAVEEHSVEPRQGKPESGKWANYGGWTSQSGFAYNGVERSNEHPTANG